MLNELVRSSLRSFVPSFGDGGEIFGRGNGIIDFYGERAFVASVLITRHGIITLPLRSHASHQTLPISTHPKCIFINSEATELIKSWTPRLREPASLAIGSLDAAGSRNLGMKN